MKNYEITLIGFNGSTDKTDNKVIWVSIPDNCIISTSPQSPLIESITELPDRLIGGIDLYVAPSS